MPSFSADLFFWGGPCEEHHQVRVLDPANQTFVIDHIIVAISSSSGFEAGGIGARRWFSNPETL